MVGSPETTVTRDLLLRRRLFMCVASELGGSSALAMYDSFRGGAASKL